MDQKLLTVIKAIISRGGDIYKETPRRLPIINYCIRLPLREEIKRFQNKERNRDRSDKVVIIFYSGMSNII